MEPDAKAAPEVNVESMDSLLVPATGEGQFASKNSIASRRGRNSSSYTNATTGSIYMDAYTGLDELEE